MSDEIIIKHCSPTLAGLKSGSLFTYRPKEGEKLRCEICRLNKLLSCKGVRVIPLAVKRGGVLVYVYRPRNLESDLKSGPARDILCPCGYDCESASRCVARLAVRLKSGERFPHEIGLFLGYPPEDVSGFIEHNAADCKLTGMWKVYGDERRAERLFRKFERCTQIYLRTYSEGNSIERLTVAV